MIMDDLIAKLYFVMNDFQYFIYVKSNLECLGHNKCSFLLVAFFAFLE